jgi:hypothetical protein
MAKRLVWKDRLVEGHFMEKGVYSTYTPTAEFNSMSVSIL